MKANTEGFFIASLSSLMVLEKVKDFLYNTSV